MTMKAGVRIIGALCTALLVVGVAAQPAAATLYVYEAFPYANGDLVKVPANVPDIGGGWTAHSGGGAKKIQIASNKIIVQQSSGSGEDDNTTFAGGRVAGTGDKFYAGFDLVVNATAPLSGTGGDVYFAHFKDSGTNFADRVFVTSKDGANYTIGFGGTSAGMEQKWATGLTFGITYRIVFSYAYTDGASELWINPSAETDTRLTLTNVYASTAIQAFAVRQASPTAASTQTIDNIKVGTTFAEVKDISVPIGACCTAGLTCTDGRTPAQCNTASGIWMGVGTVCVPGICVRGACCFGSVCSVMKEDECDALPGIYKGDNTTCTPNDPCTAACCHSDGVTCTIETFANCTNLYSGTWYPEHLVCTGFTCPTIPTEPIINELDSDNIPTVDTKEFIELKGTASMSLDGYCVVLYGTAYKSYRTIDLAGLSMRGDGYFLIGSTGMTTPPPDVEITPAWLGNGPAAAAIHHAPAANFPDGTVLSSAYLVDAIVYDNCSGPTWCDNAKLLLLLNPGQPQVRENSTVLVVGSSGLGRNESNQRCPNGSGVPRNTITYDQWLPTAGTANLCVIRGACCVSGTCSIITPAACTAAGGTYLGDETSCEGVICASVTAAGARPTANPPVAIGSGVITRDVVVSNIVDTVSSGDSKSFHVQDATGGITIFGPNTSIANILTNGGDPIVEGSVIRLSGTTTNYISLFELGGPAPIDVRLIANLWDGFPPLPVPITMAGMQDASPTAEGLESKLVKLTGVTFVDAGGYFYAYGPGYSGTYLVYVPGSPGVTATIFVPTADTFLAGNQIPSGTLDIAGILSQYDTTSPYNGGYQLVPRKWADLGQGACCAEDESCTITLPAGCVGTWMGVGTTCTSNMCTCSLLGDVNQDGFVNGLDIAGFVRAKLGQPPVGIENQACADYGTGLLNGDMATFIADLIQ